MGEAQETACGPPSEVAEEVLGAQAFEEAAAAAWEVQPCWCRLAGAAAVAGEPSAQRHEAAGAEAAVAPRP